MHQRATPIGIAHLILGKIAEYSAARKPGADASDFQPARLGHLPPHLALPSVRHRSPRAPHARWRQAGTRGAQLACRVGLPPRQRPASDGDDRNDAVAWLMKDRRRATVRLLSPHRPSFWRLLVASTRKALSRDNLQNSIGSRPGNTEPYREAVIEIRHDLLPVTLKPLICRISRGCSKTVLSRSRHDFRSTRSRPVALVNPKKPGVISGPHEHFRSGDRS